MTNLAATFASATIRGGNYAARRAALQALVAAGAAALAASPARLTVTALLRRELDRYRGTYRRADGTAVRLEFAPSTKYSGRQLAVWYYRDLTAAYGVAVEAARLVREAPAVEVDEVTELLFTAADLHEADASSQEALFI